MPIQPMTYHRRVRGKAGAINKPPVGSVPGASGVSAAPFDCAEIHLGVGQGVRRVTPTEGPP